MNAVRAGAGCRASGCHGWGGVLLLCAAMLAGCGKGPQIESYEVERSSPPVKPLDADGLRAELDQMLAAILPQPDAKRAWFFKLVAKADAAESLQTPFAQFLRSVRFDEQSSGDPAWTLPDDWTAESGDANRFATVKVPHGEQEYELAVSQLPYTGQWDEFLAANVNRWLGQLQEPPLPAKTIAAMGQEIETPAGKATLVALTGRMTATAGAMGGMPAGHPPLADAGAKSQTEVAPTESRPSELNYDAPAGWKPGTMGSMRIASFAVEADGEAADMSVTRFPDTAGMGDVALNLRRWAGEVGLEPSGDELDKLVADKTVAGLPGKYVELFGPGRGDGPLGTLALMLPREGMIWFFKLKGDRALVEKKREEFANFLDSVRFE